MRAEVPDSDKLNVVSYRLILHGGKLVCATHVIVKVITNTDSFAPQVPGIGYSNKVADIRN